jgi:uncharacterized phage-associated protein
MSRITFNFKLEKLVHALAYFAKNGVRNLTKLKAAKLLYFADKEHLLRHGRPILGDVYFCLPYGPVPSLALNEMSDAIAAPEVEDEDRRLFNSVLKVHKPWFADHPVFQAKTFDPDVFSESELEILREISKKYGQFTAGQLVDLTHREPTWTIANEARTPEGRAPIPYELFFVGASEQAQQMLEVLQSEHEERKELDSILESKATRPTAHA